ncbi:hypothetical protein PMAYCL1PPCAC_31149, partial [Pristionchus mayeri]
DASCNMFLDPRCGGGKCPEQPICVKHSEHSCRRSRCGLGKRCRMKQVPGSGMATECVVECEGGRCPDGFSCTFDENTLQPSCVAVRPQPDQPNCNTVRCASGTECIMENGRPNCRPVRPQPLRSCRDINCPDDASCNMFLDPRCSGGKCPEQPICVKHSENSCRRIRCGLGDRCRMTQEPGSRMLPNCVNGCDGVRCPIGFTCTFDATSREPSCVELRRCLNSRCSPGFECRRMADSVSRCNPI